jgi:ferritin-like metal-binding protein YciE
MLLGLQDQARLPRQTLYEEGVTDKKLTGLAEPYVNKEAKSAG